MGAYSVYLHLELLEVVPARGEQRRLIMSFVRSLADNPHTPGDFTDRDESYALARSRSLAATRLLIGWTILSKR